MLFKHHKKSEAIKQLKVCLCEECYLQITEYMIVSGGKLNDTKYIAKDFKKKKHKGWISAENKKIGVINQPTL